MSRSSTFELSGSHGRASAEMLLHKARQVRDGRETNNLYGALKEEIEAGREAFRREFIETCPSMVDYFHLELQRTLAKDNAWRSWSRLSWAFACGRKRRRKPR